MHVATWSLHTAPTLLLPSVRPVSKRLTPRLIEHLSVLPDPRIEHTKRHKLLDIVTLAVCAVLGGADHGTEIAEFGEAKRAWFARFLELPHGIPSARHLRARVRPPRSGGVRGGLQGLARRDQRNGQRRGGDRR